jgi:DNA-binding CsgD family transcriptional regulator/tetratricopeptide (TPR) repeat protein
MANRSITCRPTETARAFRHSDEDDSTVPAGIDGSRAPVLRIPKLAEVHQRPLGRGLKTLCGRRTECETLDHLLETVRAGQSGALVVRGKPGIGKTALLEYAIDSASDLSVVRAAAVESEIELPFAGLHQLCVPLLDRLACLPAPQRDALETVFRLSVGSAPDRFLVGLAVLTLVSETAKAGPLLCVVDDAQWLDRESAQALAFVARRLTAESVAILVASREPNDDFGGLPELGVQGLQDGDAGDLLSSVVGGPMDVDVRDQIVAETRGNPLALLELSRGLSPEQLAGGLGLPNAVPFSSRIEESFLRRLEDLGEETRLLLLVAAAEPIGDPALLWRAAERLAITAEAVEPAARAGLLELTPRVRFRHPLVRSTVYRAASSGARQQVHRALAEVTDAELDPDRRAWHRAQAALGPDEEVAAELECSAGRARLRGGLAAAAAFLERAVKLTLDPGSRAQRALAAAQAKHLAGAPATALGLLAIAEAGPLDELGRARIDLLRAHIEHSRNRGSDAPALLLAAAERLEPLDVRLARETYLDGLSAATFVGRRAFRGGVAGVAHAVLAGPPAPQPPRTSDLLLDGLATRFTAGYAAGAPVVRRALNAFLGEDNASDQELRWLWLASRAAVDLWEDDIRERLAIRHLQRAREAGTLTVLPLAISQRICAHAFAGELAAGASLIEEMHAATKATGSHIPPYGPLVLAAWRGREAEALKLIEATVEEVVSRGEGLGVTVTQWARAVLYNGLGRYEEALAAAERASGHPEDLAVFNWGLAELIVAAVRSGNMERAAAALERLSEITRASGTDWALGIEARSRALLSEGDAAERLYREAIERLGRTHVRVELGRAHLLYGEWLRRERRRVDAREQLRTAHEMFTAMGLEAFAGRAARELLATGERVRKRTVETREDLTAQEAQVARLARDGLSNLEIGARLFISARTVEYHLHKVFGKLNIRSRTQLPVAFPQEAHALLPTQTMPGGPGLLPGVPA